MSYHEELPPANPVALADAPSTRSSRAKQPLLAIEELSALWKVPKATIYNWVSQGRLPHLKLGRCLRFDPEEIRRFEERCRLISSGKR